MVPLPVPVWPCGADVLAMAYRAFDHWKKHEHDDCDHDSILECIDVYGREDNA